MKFGNFISLTRYCINKSQKLNLNYSFGDCSRAAAASRVEHFVMVVNGWCGIEVLVCGSGSWGLGRGGGGGGSDDWGAQEVRYFVNCIKR